MSDSHLMPTYNRSELAFTHGEGAWSYTQDGTRYLDFSSGIAVNALGHAHPALVAALTEQAQKIWHVSNAHQIPGQEVLADLLCAKSFADVVFFCNSGTEAVEGMIKTIRAYHPDRQEIISFCGAFHGRSMAAISAAYSAANDVFAPYLPGFSQIDGFDIDAVRAALHDKVAGIILEPIQGEGGVRVAPPRFLKELRALADDAGILLGFDEVQTGIGRTGKLFAYEWASITPDVMALAKGLGGGFPIGAVLATRDASRGMVAGRHGSTFGGNPLAMAVGKAVMEVVCAPDFLPHLAEMAGYFRQKLAGFIAEYGDIVDEQRGEGLMIGLHCVVENVKLLAALREARLVCVRGSDNIVRILPPLNVKRAELDVAFEALCVAGDKLRALNDGGVNNA